MGGIQSALLGAFVLLSSASEFRQQLSFPREARSCAAASGGVGNSAEETWDDAQIIPKVTDTQSHRTARDGRDLTRS